MAELDLLTNAFLASHPEDAARVLERLPEADAAALFERTPARLGGPTVAAMLPYAASRCLLRLDQSRAALLLTSMSIPAVAAVLRYVPERERIVLLDALPAGTALACRALLGYPEDSVGACSDTEIVVLPPSSRASDALQALRAGHINRSSPVYVVDPQQRPLGQIEVLTLLRAEPHDRLDALMRPLSGTLAAATPLAGALLHPVWRETDIAPVVERSGALVGVVQRRTVQRVQQRHDPSASSVDSLFAALSLGYWHLVVGLIEAIVSLLASPPPEQS